MKKYGVILGYLSILIQNLSAFILTPLMILVFGDGDFGVYKLALSIASYFALADFGLNNSIIRYISEYRAKNDKVKEGSFIFISFITIAVASIIVIAATIILKFNLTTVFKKSFTKDELNLLSKLIDLVLINGVINLFINLLNGIIVSYEKFVFVKSVNIFKTIIRFILVFILLNLNYSTFGVLLVDVIFTISIFIASLYYCFVILNIRLNTKEFNFKFVYEILSYSSIVFIDAIAYALFWSTDSIIIGIKMSSLSVGIYAIGTQLFTIFIVLSNVISEVLMPGVVNMVNTNITNSELTNYMVKIGRIKLELFALPLIGYIFFGDQFINLWVGKEYSIVYFVSLLVVIPFIFSSLSDVGTFVMWAKNKHKAKSIFSLIASFINVILTIVLVNSYGIIGAAIGTSFAILVIQIFNGFYFHKILDLNMIDFYIGTFKNILIPISITSVFAFILSKFEIRNFLTLLTFAIILTLIYAFVMWKYCLNNHEKSMIKGIDFIKFKR